MAIGHVNHFFSILDITTSYVFRNDHRSALGYTLKSSIYIYIYTFIYTKLLYLNSIKYFKYSTIAVNPHDTSQSPIISGALVHTLISDFTSSSSAACEQLSTSPKIFLSCLNHYTI